MFVKTGEWFGICAVFLKMTAFHITLWISFKNISFYQNLGISLAYYFSQGYRRKNTYLTEDTEEKQIVPPVGRINQFRKQNMWFKHHIFLPRTAASTSKSRNIKSNGGNQFAFFMKIILL